MGWFASSLHHDTLTFAISSSGDPDADGVPVSNPAPALTVPGCNVQPVATVQTTDGGVQTVTSYRASLPGTGHAIAPGTPATWLGHDGQWAVDGEPLEYSGTGALDHTEVTITRARG